MSSGAGTGAALDVAMIDIWMPQLKGSDAMVRPVATVLGMNVVGPSVCAQSSYVGRLFAAGARGYIMKRSTGQMLIQAVRTVAAGERHVDPPLSRTFVVGLD